jgi:type I site-specific restriction-modification system R (restriction) subunit
MFSCGRALFLSHHFAGMLPAPPLRVRVQAEYRADDGLSRIELRAVNETAWLTQAQMAELFQTSPQAITQLIAAIYEDAEADEVATCKQLLQVRQEGGREVSRQLKHYNLDVILSVGYWDRQMARYKTEDEFNRQVTEAFKGSGDPEILIVVSKLLTGFDAPRNTVLYVCKSSKEHNLLQAIAGVNRLFDAEDGAPKEFGFIIDYEGLLGELDKALTTYSAFEGYDASDGADDADIRGTKLRGSTPMNKLMFSSTFRVVERRRPAWPDSRF